MNKKLEKIIKNKSLKPEDYILAIKSLFEEKDEKGMLDLYKFYEKLDEGSKYIYDNMFFASVVANRIYTSGFEASGMYRMPIMPGDKGPVIDFFKSTIIDYLLKK